MGSAHALTSLFNFFFCEISGPISLLFKRFFSWLHSWRPPHAFLWVKRRLTSYDLYGSQLEEDVYWRSASSGQRRLQVSNAHYVKHRGTKLPPLVMSYVPSLLPIYRGSRRDIRRDDYLSPQTFCKWHRMVFPKNVCDPFIRFPSSYFYLRYIQLWYKLPSYVGTILQGTAG